MCNVKWLQLSDMHFGYSDQSVNEMRTRLKSDIIRQAVKNQIGYDFLLIAGDIVYAKCLAPEKAYDEAANYIRDIQKRLNISKRHTFVVPGNHDIDILDSVREKSINEVRSKYSTRSGSISKIVDKTTLGPTEHFKKFYKKATGMDYLSLPIVFSPKGKMVDILCLDSSYTCLKSKDDKGQLVVGMDSVSKEMAVHDDQRGLIVVIHHGLDWLKNEERKILVSMLSRPNSVYCCGHIHSSEASTIINNSMIVGESISLSVTPTFMDEDEEGKPTTDMGYNIGVYNDDSICIKSLMWNHKDNTFSIDWTFPSNAESSITPNPFLERVGIRINACELFLHRTQRGLTLRELAYATGIREESLKAYERLDSTYATDTVAVFPPLKEIDDLVKIAYALSVSPEILIADTAYIERNLERYEKYSKKKGLSSMPKHREKTAVVVFDFDGTLTQSAFLKSSWEKMWVECGYSESDCRELHEQYMLGKFNHQTWCDKTAHKFKSKHFDFEVLRRIANSTQLIADCREVIFQLYEDNIQLYIVSGSELELIKLILGDELYSKFRSVKANQMMFDKEQKLTHIVGTKYDFEGKADYVRGIIERGRYSPTSVVYFGNSFNDHSVCKTGVKTVCINPKNTNPYNREHWTYSETNVDSMKSFLNYIDM